MEEYPTRFKDITQVIDFAIKREQEAQELYLTYSKSTNRAGFIQLLISMVEMEKEHEKKLLGLKEEGRLNEIYSSGSIQDLKISDYLVEVDFSPDMEYGDFLILVIKKERGSEKLYRHLESLTTDQEVKQIFQIMAEEEKKHKIWAQDRYDLEILKEN